MPKLTDYNREFVSHLLTKELQQAMRKHGVYDLPETLRAAIGQMANVSIHPDGYTVRPDGWLSYIDYGFVVATFDDMLQAHKINNRKPS